MRIAIGADHAGFHFKEDIKDYLERQDYEIKDFGTDSAESADYPNIAVGVAREVSSGKARFGVLVCGSGVGMAIVANKIPGIRCATCYSEPLARMSRQHNDANILSLAARYTNLQDARKIVTAFLETDFDSGGRHERRVKQIHSLTGR